MIRTIFLTGSAMLGVALALPSVATEGQRAWTLDDQLTVPEIRTLAIAADGMSAVYVVRIAVRASDKTVAVLRHHDLASGQTRKLLRADRKRVRQVKSVCVLVKLGGGWIK